MVTRICVLGETLEQAVYLLDLLCRENPGDIYRRSINVGIMKDETELIAMSIGDIGGFQGRDFDYVFYEEGALVSYCKNHGAALEYLEKRCLAYSIIPREFQWSAVKTSIV